MVTVEWIRYGAEPAGMNAFDKSLREEGWYVCQMAGADNHIDANLNSNFS
jgi:hypothetical protein